MESRDVKRKLTTILEADVEGYSRLMAADEETTLKVLEEYRDVIEDLLARHDGRLVGTAGDAVLAEFGSAVEAVRCAVAIQEDLNVRNAELPADRQMRFRIGINVGDVMISGDDLFGDAVNVAARLEGLAEPGGVCISGSAFDQIKNKVSLGFEDIGPQEVKNIADPVPAYRLVPGPVSVRTGARAHRRRWVPAVAAVVVAIIAIAGGLTWWQPWAPSIELASVDRLAFPLPDKPSIAVLPFDNLSGDPQQDYFADGITDNIITTLSKISSLFVIARNSTFTYRGTPVKVQQVAEELGVRYVLEGSVQRAGDDIRISAQLIDALTGDHLWVEQYDRQLTDLFDVQDEITHEIAMALQVELTEGEQLRVWRQSTRDLAAWNLLAQGVDHFDRFVRVENARARRLFEQAIASDPDFAVAYTLTAWTHWLDAQRGWSEPPNQSIERAAELAQHALALDDSLPDVHALLAAILMIRGDYEEAVATGERAVALNPSHATNTALLGMILHNAGRPEEAIARIKTAMRLSPYYPDWFLFELAWAYEKADQTEQAIVAFREFIAREPEAIQRAKAHIGSALALYRLGREDDARAEIAKAVETAPYISADLIRQDSIAQDREALERGIATLRRLGLPE